MIELIDAYIKTKLEVITFNGDSVTVYNYDPIREHGETAFPCIAFLRQPLVIADNNVRTDIYAFIEDEGETQITLPKIMGGGTLVGPTTYTRKPYSIPVDLSYEIRALATEPAHAASLIESIYSVLPPKHTPEISGQFPVFMPSDYVNMDEREKPLYINAIVLEVYDLWVDRFEAETYQSIRDIDFEAES